MTSLREDCKQSETGSPRSLTDPQLQEAAWAAHGYGFVPIGGEVLVGGRINETWRVMAPAGALVLRRYPPTRKKRQIDFEIDVLEHLARSGCRVPSPVRPKLPRSATTSDVSAEFSIRPFAWFEWIEGRVVLPQELPSPPALRALLAPVFDALRSFRAPFRPVPETRVFEAQLAPFLRELPLPEQTRLRQLFTQLSHWEAGHVLPSGVVHADIHPGNVLRDEMAQLWLIDFDDAHVGTRALDWILAALEFSFDESGFDEESYLDYLDAIRPPFATPEEREAEPMLRQILVLKFACIEASLGTPSWKNRYLRLLA